MKKEDVVSLIKHNHKELSKDDGVDRCNRTGHCCLLIIHGRLSRIPCNKMKRNNEGYYCGVYDDPDRIGSDIGFGNKCSLREAVPFSYPGCGYNRPEWPLITIGSKVSTVRKIKAGVKR